LLMLLTTPREEFDKEKYLTELTERERQSSQVNARLTEELKAAEAERDKEVHEMNEKIRSLQAEIHRVEKQSEENIKDVIQEGNTQTTVLNSVSEAKRSTLQTELNQTQAQYNALLAEHRERELALRKKKFQVETEVENWIQKYDSDMGERQTEYEQIDFVYTAEKRQLSELEERFKTLSAEYDAIQDARRVAREAREAAERELQMCVRAATAIQAFWRSYKVRKAIKSKKKKGAPKKPKNK